MHDALEVIPAGLMLYRDALALQHQLHERVANGEARAYLILVEHPPVVTLGKHADPAHLLAAQGIEVVSTDRGGEVTAHEPGQLVAYPILRLSDFGLGAKGYVAVLERAVTQVLEAMGVKASTDAQHPGVWTGAGEPRKICAIGVRISRRVTLHGLALNVCNDLKTFDRMVPCGIVGRGVTSLTQCLGRPATVDEVAPRLASALARGLGIPAGATKMWPGLQWEAGVFKI